MKSKGEEVMSAEQTLENLEALHIDLWLEGEKLKYRAPQGVMTPELLAQLKKQKQELIQILKGKSEELLRVSEPNKKHEPFPLTDIQAAYLYGRDAQTEAGGVPCHIYFELGYEELSHEKVKKAWNSLIAHHDMLRVVISKNGYQKILKDVPEFPIPYFQRNEECSDHLEQLREEMGNRCYDTEVWPLYEVAVTSMPDRAILHFSMDFMVADWTGIWMILGQFEDLYENPEYVLPKLDITFRDYVLTEKKMEKGRQYTAALNYWKGHIAALPAAPRLPVLWDPDEKEKKVSFYRKSLRLEEGVWRCLKEQAAMSGVTPNAVLLAAYARVLAKWSGMDKFCINLTLGSRKNVHERIGELAGDFTSVNLLKVSVQDHGGFWETAQNINRRLFQDLEYNQYSGVKVLRDLSQYHGRQVLMPYVFTSAVYTGDQKTLKGEMGFGISRTPQVFIDCQVMNAGTELWVNWDIRRGIFADDMIEEMFAEFSRNLYAASDGVWSGQRGAPDTYDDHSGPAQRFMNEIKEYSEEGRVAVLHGDIPCTYEELHKRIVCVTAFLKEREMPCGGFVTAALEKSPWQIAAMLGAMLYGGIYIPAAGAGGAGVSAGGLYLDGSILEQLEKKKQERITAVSIGRRLGAFAVDGGIIRMEDFITGGSQGKSLEGLKKIQPLGSVFDRRYVLDVFTALQTGATILCSGQEINSSGSTLEASLTKIANEMLGTADISVSDNLYLKGADSLVMSRMTGRIKEERDLTIRFNEILGQFMKTPSIREIAAYIHREMNSDDKEQMD